MNRFGSIFRSKTRQLLGLASFLGVVEAASPLRASTLSVSPVEAAVSLQASSAPDLSGAGVMTARPHLTLTPSADTSLFEHTPDNNLGGSTLVSGKIGFSGQYKRARALVQFSFEGVPPDATVTSATLVLTVSSVPREGGPQTPTFDLHRLLLPWSEGSTGDLTSPQGDTAKPGETTWNARFFPPTLWSAPGAQAPVDFSPLVSSKAVIPGYGTFYFTNLVADVQFWLAHPGENFGWILICEDEVTPYTARRFSPREDPVSANAPSLELEYLPVPKIDHAELSGNQLNLHFVVEAGLESFVQQRDSLSLGDWITFTNLPSVSATSTNVVATPLTPFQRFYRIGVQ